MSTDARQVSRRPTTDDGRSTVQAGERELSFGTAVDRGTAALAELGISAELQDLGGDPGAWRCVLTRDEQWLANGCGKGHREAARAGAVFEALEHHLSGRAGLRATTELRSAHDLAAGVLHGDGVAAALADGPDGLLACRRYRSLTGDGDALIPVFLSCIDYPTATCADQRREIGDSYDYDTVVRYSVNSGCASGASVTEATVHALNEIVERDAWSMMLIEVFLARRHEITVIDPDSLPEDLAWLLEHTEHVMGDRVSVIDMTTDLGVPAVMAYVTPAPGSAATYFGCGASLSRGHAVSRALTELLQVVAVETVAGPPRHDREHLRRYPPFHAASTMDLREPLEVARRVPLVDTPAPSTPAGHLERLVGVLSERGHRAYAHDLHVADNGVAVVAVLVPGLERFMVVHLGSLVVPGPRGMAVLGRGA